MVWTAAWTDFVICLFFGYFGAHKFRERKAGMGILYLCTLGLFGIGWFVDVIRYLAAAIKGERIQGNRPRRLDANAELPIITTSNLVLSNGETCHYCGPATFVKTKNVIVGYSGGSQGTSIRIAKGMSVRLGAHRATPIRGDVQERTPGVLSITNKRVVFSGNKGAFDKRITALSAVTPYKDGIAFQFGAQQYPLETKETEYVYEILARIVNSSEDA
ncbi:MAG: TM2 domain-containing protein [Eubacteriales bacterium]|nr:TM2 domain-containing protein [Eubacteriales bacterium]